MRKQRLRVAHIVPTMSCGGVEVGISRSYAELCRHFDYRIFHVLPAPGILDCGQRPVMQLLRDLLLGRWRPDVVVTSLSWSHPIGHLCRCLGIPWVAFFHSAGFSHGRDAFSQRWAWRWANHRLADSAATRLAMSEYGQHDCRLIPYRFMETADSQGAWAERSIDLIWVGRSHPDKRPDLFVAFWQAVMRLIPRGHAVMVVAGEVPEGLTELAAAGGWQITTYQSLDNRAVRELLGQARFYVLLSDYEGMSMSTIEAVSAGCVPVVRPVGEIPAYVCAESGFHVDDITDAGLADMAARVVTLWQDADHAKIMTDRAQAALESFPDYVSTFMRAMREYSCQTRSL
ncbi:MAG: glycosyltransferase family 4 protein [Pseudomonadota bacterium]